MDKLDQTGVAQIEKMRRIEPRPQPGHQGVNIKVLDDPADVTVVADEI